MGKSSKDKRDAYYRLAKEQGWRARSAFKLLQLDEEFNLFADVTRVVDLCAAPGSWSQVLSRVLIKGESFGRTAWENKQEATRQELLRLTHPAHPLFTSTPNTSNPASVTIDNDEKREQSKPPSKPRKDVKIVAIDLQPMSPLPGITCLRADITHPATIPLLLNALDASPSPSPSPSTTTTTTTTSPSPPTTPAKVDLVISDGAPDVTGLHDLDIYIQSQLLFSALNLALHILRPGGTFVAKIFRGRNVDLLYAQLKLFFKRVVVAKPRSSRASSVEAFVVCRVFEMPVGYEGRVDEPLGVGQGLSDMVRAVEARRAIIAGRVLQDWETGCWGVENGTRYREGEGVVEVELDDREEARWIAPFMACGDLGSYDADASYHLPKDRVSLEPVQPPTAPPYRRALEMRKRAGGGFGKTGVAT